MQQNPLIKILVETKNLTEDTVYIITSKIGKYLYCQVLKLYAYIIHLQLLIPKPMSYEDSNHIFSTWKVYSFLFIRLICGYTLRIVSNIDFGLHRITPTNNAPIKNPAKTHLIKNLVRSVFNRIHTVSCNLWYEILIIF